MTVTFRKLFFWLLAGGTLVACETTISDLKNPKPILDADARVERPQQGVIKPDGACDLPLGGFIENGVEIELFQIDSVPCEEFCENNMQVRKCEDGILLGNKDYVHTTCNELGCPSCEHTPPDSDEPYIVPHGESLSFYGMGNVACGETCESQAKEFTCNRGDFVSDDGTDFGLYPYGSCQIDKCGCLGPSFDDPNQQVLYDHNTELDFYTTDDLRCGSCEEIKQSRTCDDGKWSGEDVYAFITCSEQNDCQDCPYPLDPDTFVSHGTMKSFALAPMPACGVGCQEKMRMCDDGELQIGPTGDGTFFEQYVYPDCNCNCTIPGSDPLVQVPQGGAPLVYFTQATIGCLDDQADYQVNIVCGDDGLSATLESDGSEVDLDGFNNWTTQAPTRDVCRCDPYFANVKDDGETFTGVTQATGDCHGACPAPDAMICQKQDYQGEDAMVIRALSGPNAGQIVQVNDDTLIPGYVAETCETVACTCTHDNNIYVADTSPPFPAFTDLTGVCSNNCVAESFRCVYNADEDETEIVHTTNPSSFDIADYPYGTCQEANCDCLRGQGFNNDQWPNALIPQGEDFPAYQANQGTCFDTCASNREDFICGLVGDTPTILRESDQAPDVWDADVWQFANCQEGNCTCETPWGSVGLGPFVAYVPTQAQDSCTYGYETYNYVCVQGDSETSIEATNGSPDWDPDTYDYQQSPPASDCECTVDAGSYPVDADDPFRIYKIANGVCNDNCLDNSAQFYCVIENEVPTVVAAPGFEGEVPEDYPQPMCDQPGCLCYDRNNQPIIPDDDPNDQFGAFYAYSMSQGTCDNFCQNNRKRFSCVLDNGLPTIVAHGDNPGINPDDYMQHTCGEDQSCSCDWIPGQPDLPADQFRDAWLASQGNCNEQCSDLERTFKCEQGDTEYELVPFGHSDQWADHTWFPNCTNADCLCELPWGQQWTNGQEGYAYKETQVACGTVCEENDNAKHIRCEVTDLPRLIDIDTGLEFDDEGLFVNAFCQPLGDCAGDGGGDGGGDGDGFGQGNYDDSSGGGGGAGGPASYCGQMQVPDYIPPLNKIIHGSVLSTTNYTNQNCELPWQDPAPPGLPADFSLAGTIVSGLSVSAFTQEEVSCNESCEDFRVVLYCDYNGDLIKPDGVVYPACKKEDGCP